MKSTHHGSCHCGAVKFECELDLAATTSRCNCSMCAKGRFWKLVVPSADVRVLAGADMLADYQFGRDMIHHRFCTRCGIKPFGHFSHPELGDCHAINLACLDDLAPEQLERMDVKLEDGKHDRWDRVPEHGAWL
jgi:hypothetical protein